MAVMGGIGVSEWECVQSGVGTVTSNRSENMRNLLKSPLYFCFFPFWVLEKSGGKVFLLLPPVCCLEKEVRGPWGKGGLVPTEARVGVG